MPKELYLLDSTYATRNYDSTTTSIDGNSYHSFNITYPLKYPLKNVSRMTLKSVEIPLILNNIRTLNNTATIGFTFTYGSFINVYVSNSIISGQYNSISSLITAINTAISIVISSYTGFTISFSSTLSNFGFTVCAITTNASNLVLTPSLLATVLGFIKMPLSSNTGSLIGTAPINLYAIDTCIYIQIANIPIMNNNNFTSFGIAPYTFKIPLNNIVNNTIYFNDTDEHQSIYFNKTNFVLDKLNINVYDRTGTNLTGFYNWCMTLLIEYDDINNNEQHFLNFNN